MPQVTSGALLADVLDLMHSTNREKKWKKGSPTWRLFMRARKEFIQDQLINLGITAKELSQLGDIRRYRLMAQLEKSFLTSFFSYSRDGDWMEEAVGESEEWIKFDGMAAWHVRAALADLKRTADGTAVASASFDAVKDAAEQNVTFNKD